MDHNAISRQAYRELASVQLDLLREHFVSAAKKQLDEKMRNAAPIRVINKSLKVDDREESLLAAARSMRDILPIVLKRIKLLPGEIVRLKVAGDGRNVGRKRKHVMVVFCVFQAGSNVLKASHQHTLNLIVGSEDYELMKVFFPPSLLFSILLSKKKIFFLLLDFPEGVS